MTPPPVVAADATLLEAWDVRHLQPVQLMVCNVLQKWIANYLYDDDLEPPLLQRFSWFVEGLAVNERTAKVGKLLKASMIKRREKCSRSRQSSMPRELMFSKPPPPLLFNEDEFDSHDRPARVPARRGACAREASGYLVELVTGFPLFLT